MAIILKANKVNLFVSSVLFVFWYHSPNVLDTPHICNISWLRVNESESILLDYVLQKPSSTTSSTAIMQRNGLQRGLTAFAASNEGFLKPILKSSA
jgi:hypothetical protein